MFFKTKDTTASQETSGVESCVVMTSINFKLVKRIKKLETEILDMLQNSDQLINQINKELKTKLMFLISNNRKF